MSAWERQYRDAVSDITSPESLDRQILQRAKQFKPPANENRWLSKTATACAALGVALLLIHPAQQLGALTPDQHPANSARENPLADWRYKRAPIENPDPWFELRSQVKAGSYIELCHLWRRQQQGPLPEKLPKDLEDKARAHCRLLR